MRRQGDRPGRRHRSPRQEDGRRDTPEVQESDIALVALEQIVRVSKDARNPGMGSHTVGSDLDAAGGIAQATLLGVALWCLLILALA
jgi:hypothetical protein